MRKSYFQPYKQLEYTLRAQETTKHNVQITGYLVSETLFLLYIKIIIKKLRSRMNAYTFERGVLISILGFPNPSKLANVTNRVQAEAAMCESR